MTAVFDRQLHLLAEALIERGVAPVGEPDLETELRQQFGQAPWLIPADFEPVKVARGLDEFLLLARPEDLRWLPDTGDVEALLDAQARKLPGQPRAELLQQLIAEWTAGRGDLARWRRQAELIGTLAGRNAPGVAHVTLIGAAVDQRMTRLTRQAMAAMRRAEDDDQLAAVRRAAGLKPLSDLSESLYDGNKIMAGSAPSRLWASDGFVLVQLAALKRDQAKLLSGRYRGTDQLSAEANTAGLWEKVLADACIPGQVLGWESGKARGRLPGEAQHVAYAGPLAPDVVEPVVALDAARLNNLRYVAQFDGLRLSPTRKGAVVVTRGDEPIGALMPLDVEPAIDLAAARERAAGRSARQILANARRALAAARQGG